MRKVLFLIVSFFTITIYAGVNNSPQGLNNINKNFFIENKGQWPSEVKYLARVGGMNAWITNSGVVYDYYKIIKNYKQQQLGKLTPDKKADFEQKNTSIKGHVVQMQLIGVNAGAVSKGDNKQEGYYNYFIGKDKNKWASDVPLYGNLQINEIYPSINVKYYFDGNSIRYDYIVKSGADVTKLKMKFNGQESIRVNEKGELVIKTSLGEVTNGKLYSYQSGNDNKIEVACKFKQNQDGSIGFDVKEYDRTKDLIIDPLIYSTFIGHNGEEAGVGIAIDAENNAYITGSSTSINYPLTQGAYQTTLIGYRDVFVTKINSSGSALVYSTFIGGRSLNYSAEIVVDHEGNAYIAGGTKSTDYPSTLGAFQSTLNGDEDVFVTKLSPGGNALIYSTLIGGTYEDYANSLVIDSSGNVYITGSTKSNNYPVTPGAFQTTAQSWYSYADVFVTKLNADGSALVYSTYLGGASEESGSSIVIDPNGNAYIGGHTYSDNYPITPGSFQTIKGGMYDSFISKLNSTGNSLIYSTYFGGRFDDYITSIDIDSDGNAYLTGFTNSPNFHTTPGAFQTIYTGGNSGITDNFVTKINPSGKALVYSTLIGGSDNDMSYSITTDANRNAYITGTTYSIDYPTTPGAYQDNIKGGYCDAFLTKINPSGSTLIYSTYIGGNFPDNGYALKIDTNENACITGSTRSLDYPTTFGAFQTSHSDSLYNNDIFVTKLDLPYVQYLKLISPKGGEIWPGDSIRNIRWMSSISSNIKIEYTTNNGSSWNTIVNSTPINPANYQWSLPNHSSTNCKVRITSLEIANLSDISDSTFTIQQSTAVEENNLIPISNNLSYNYPNPFNPVTNISYSVAQESNVVIRVYDVLGKEVTKLVNENKKAGMYCVQFKAASLASGMYFYTIQMMSIDGKESYRATKKMLLLK